MLKILFLEDDLLLGKLYTQKLNQAGFEILWLNSTDEIEKNLQNFQPDFCILDHGMRGQQKTGIEIIPILKKVRPKTRIIVLSNYNKFQFEKQALLAGAEKFLLKIDTSPKKLLEHLH